MFGVRLIAFFTLLILSTVVPIYLFVPLIFAYALAWRSYELILLGMLVDAYFGLGPTIPYYTIYTCAIVACVEWIKPSLLVYNK